MFQVRTGVSVALFVIVWFALCVQCQRLDELEIRRNILRNEIDSNPRRSHRFQDRRIRLEKFERRMTLAERTWIAGNESVLGAVGLNLKTSRNFRMNTRKSEDGDLNSILASRSTVERFERDSRVMSLHEKRILPERSIERRTFEERRIMPSNRRTNNAEDRRRFRDELEFYERRVGKLSEEQRILFRDRVRNRVTERRRTRSADFANRSFGPSRRRISDSRISNVIESFNFGIVGASLQLLYSKLKDNLIAIFLSVIFLMDCVNEFFRNQKDSKVESKKSMFMLNTSAFGKIFC